jgi:hypothetical protein
VPKRAYSIEYVRARACASVNTNTDSNSWCYKSIKTPSKGNSWPQIRSHPYLCSFQYDTVICMCMSDMLSSLFGANQRSRSLYPLFSTTQSAVKFSGHPVPIVSLGRNKMETRKPCSILTSKLELDGRFLLLQNLKVYEAVHKLKNSLHCLLRSTFVFIHAWRSTRYLYFVASSAFRKSNVIVWKTIHLFTF